jgi:hypothetical protein
MSVMARGWDDKEMAAIKRNAGKCFNQVHVKDNGQGQMRERHRDAE